MNDPYSIVEWTMMKNVVKYLSLNLWWRYDEWCVEECCFIDCWMKYEMNVKTNVEINAEIKYVLCWSCVEVVLKLCWSCVEVVLKLCH